MMPTQRKIKFFLTLGYLVVSLFSLNVQAIDYIYDHNNRLKQVIYDNDDRIDYDFDGVGNPVTIRAYDADTDSDNDGTPDIFDNCPSVSNADQANTDQLGNDCSADDDKDGLPEAWEIANGTNPSLADGFGDINNNGYTNLEEYLAAANPKLDSDRDGMFDQWEIDHGFKPNDSSDCPSWVCGPNPNGWRSILYKK